MLNLSKYDPFFYNSTTERLNCYDSASEESAVVAD